LQQQEILINYKLVNGKSVNIANENVEKIFGNKPKNGDNANVKIDITVVEKSNITKKENEFSITIQQKASNSSNNKVKKNNSSESNSKTYSYEFNTSQTLEVFEKPSRDEAQTYIKNRYGSSSDNIILLPNGNSVVQLSTTLKCTSLEGELCKVKVGKRK